MVGWRGVADCRRYLTFPNRNWSLVDHFLAEDETLPAAAANWTFTWLHHSRCSQVNLARYAPLSRQVEMDVWSATVDRDALLTADCGIVHDQGRRDNSGVPAHMACTFVFCL